MDSPSRFKHACQDIAIGATAANLWFLPYAKVVLVGWIDPRAHTFVLASSFYDATALALLLLMLLFSAAASLVRILEKYVHPALVTLFFLAALFSIIRRLRKYEIITVGYFADYFRWMPYAVFVLFCLILFGAAGFVVVKYAQLVKRYLYAALILLFPFAVIVLGQLIFKGATGGTYAEWGYSAVGARPGSRLALFVFDELDSRALTNTRPKGLILPSFDRLAASSTVVTPATSPTNWTETSIPSMLTGKNVQDLGLGDSGELTINSEGSVSIWAETNNLFDAVSRSGGSIGIVGWYHSYCGAMAPRAKRCWTAPPKPLPSGDMNLVEKTLDIIRSSYHFDRAFARVAESRQFYARGRAAEILTDSTLAFVLLHLPLPHSPTLRTFQGNGYFGNLLLADSTLGVLRDSMEQADLWDDATVIVTSDHGTYAGQIGARDSTRSTDERGLDVPLFIKFPYQSTAFHVNVPTTTRVIAALVPDILSGKVRSPEELTRYLITTRSHR